MDNNDVDRERNSGKTMQEAMFAAHMQAEARRVAAANASVPLSRPSAYGSLPSQTISTRHNTPHDGAWEGSSTYEPFPWNSFLKFVRVSAIALAAVSLMWIFVIPRIDEWNATQDRNARFAQAALENKARADETSAAIRQAVMVTIDADPVTHKKIWVFGDPGPKIYSLSSTEASVKMIEKWPDDKTWNQMPVTCKAHLRSGKWTVNGCSIGTITASW